MVRNWAYASCDTKFFASRSGSNFLRACALELSLVPRQVGLCLLQQRLQRPRIDLEQRLAFDYVLSVAKRRIDDLAVDARLTQPSRTARRCLSPMRAVAWSAG